MRATKKILVSGLALLFVSAGCSKHVDTDPSIPPASNHAAPSTNPAPAFTVKKEDGNWWLISPTGKRFLSLGVCVVTQGSSKEDFDPENPSYAASQHYPSPLQWAQATSA